MKVIDYSAQDKRLTTPCRSQVAQVRVTADFAAVVLVVLHYIIFWRVCGAVACFIEVLRPRKKWIWDSGVVEVRTSGSSGKRHSSKHAETTKVLTSPNLLSLFLILFFALLVFF